MTGRGCSWVPIWNNIKARKYEELKLKAYVRCEYSDCCGFTELHEFAEFEVSPAQLHSINLHCFALVQSSEMWALRTNRSFQWTFHFNLVHSNGCTERREKIPKQGSVSTSVELLIELKSKFMNFKIERYLNRKKLEICFSLPLPCYPQAICIHSTITFIRYIHPQNVQLEIMAFFLHPTRRGKISSDLWMYNFWGS